MWLLFNSTVVARTRFAAKRFRSGLTVRSSAAMKDQVGFDLHATPHVFLVERIDGWFEMGRVAVHAWLAALRRAKVRKSISL